MQQAASRDIDNGYLASAATKLKEANDKLNAAAVGLIEAQNQAAEGMTTEQESYGWVLIALGGIVALAGLLVYLFSKTKG